MKILATQHSVTYTVLHGGEHYVRQVMISSELEVPNQILWYFVYEGVAEPTSDPNLIKKLESEFNKVVE